MLTHFCASGSYKLEFYLKKNESQDFEDSKPTARFYIMEENDCCIALILIQNNGFVLWPTKAVLFTLKIIA